MFMPNVGNVSGYKWARQHPRDLSKSMLRQAWEACRSPEFKAACCFWTDDKPGHAEQRRREHARRRRRKRRS